MTFFRCALATTLLAVAVTACQPAPAHAGAGTAAWSTAGSIWRALGADLNKLRAELALTYGEPPSPDEHH